jgi:hypothetical protein
MSEEKIGSLEIFVSLLCRGEKFGQLMNERRRDIRFEMEFMQNLHHHLICPLVINGKNLICASGFPERTGGNLFYLESYFLCLGE